MSSLENIDTRTLMDELAQNTELLTKLFKGLKDTDTEYQKSKKIVQAIQAELERRRRDEKATPRGQA